MSIPEITVSAGGGPVSLQVREQRRPQRVVAVVWRFDAAARREGAAGEVTREIPDVPLGAPCTIDGKTFVVEGFVVPCAEDPPEPYQVVVSLRQDGRELHSTVPFDHGSGSIGAQEVRFRYPFRIRAG